MIGQRIKYLRKSKSLTLEELAEQLNSSASFLSEVERDVKKPGIDLVISLKRFFGVSIDWLLTGEAPEKKDHREACSPRELEYVEKLLRIFREKRERTAIAIMNNLDEFLETPDKEEDEIPFSERKKGGMQ